jgi:hypothetical protein
MRSRVSRSQSLGFAWPGILASSVRAEHSIAVIGGYGKSRPFRIAVIVTDRPVVRVSQILLHLRNRLRNSVSVVALSWPQISSLNELCNHPARRHAIRRTNEGVHILPNSMQLSNSPPRVVIRVTSDLQTSICDAEPGKRGSPCSYPQHASAERFLAIWH